MSAADLEELFAARRRAGGTALLPFMTAGLPDPGHSVEMFQAMAESGADAFEVGMPYPRVIPHSDGAGVIDRVGQGMPLKSGFPIRIR